MPCRVDPPSQRELDEIALEDFLDEIGEPTKRTERVWMGYARPGWDIQRKARHLCAWCKKHDVTKKSLELQIWWRDHQKEDARHKREDAARRKRKLLRAQALKKLSPEELEALRDSE